MLILLGKSVNINVFCRHISNKFIPTYQPAGPDDVRNLENFLRDKQNVLVLTGAGISTESGSYNSMAVASQIILV